MTNTQRAVLWPLQANCSVHSTHTFLLNSCTKEIYRENGSCYSPNPLTRNISNCPYNTAQIPHHLTLSSPLQLCLKCSYSWDSFWSLKSTIQLASDLCKCLFLWPGTLLPTHEPPPSIASQPLILSSVNLFNELYFISIWWVPLYIQTHVSLNFYQLSLLQGHLTL